MINIESIYPYTIVGENGFYGIINNKSNLIVPCIMDEITNDKDDEIGLEYWADFFSVLIIKNGKYGFFTRNGKFIEPAYENFAIDPCGGDIHVKINECFGVFSAPDYLFEELPAEYSFLAEIESEDNDF